MWGECCGVRGRCPVVLAKGDPLVAAGELEAGQHGVAEDGIALPGLSPGTDARSSMYVYIFAQTAVSLVSKP